MVVTDPDLAAKEPASVVLEALRESGIEAVLFDQVRVEPTDESIQAAIEFATEGSFDGYVAVGGGSSIDTAKAANLYATYPADFLAYVNAADRSGASGPGQLEAPDRGADHGRDGERDDGRGDLRLHPVARQDGHRTPRAPPGARPDRPGQHPRAAPPGRRVLGSGRAQPCRRVVHRLAVPPAAAPRNIPAFGRRTRGRTRSATSGPARAIEMVGALPRPGDDRPVGR